MTLVFKVLGFPFLFLLETFASAASDWGPDCAQPVSANDRDDHNNQLLHNRPFVLMLLFASIFGGMHFITWSFSMPTVTELWMWRSASIALMLLPILALLCLQAGISSNRYSGSIAPLLGIFGFVLLLTHPVIRLIIAVDSVLLLRSLPDTAYLVLSWSDAIPSF